MHQNINGALQVTLSDLKDPLQLAIYSELFQITSKEIH